MFSRYYSVRSLVAGPGSGLCVPSEGKGSKQEDHVFDAYEVRELLSCP